MCLQQYIRHSFVGKFRSSVIISGVLLFVVLVAVFAIRVPDAHAATTVSTGTACVRSDRAYTVVQGDTLSMIGYRYSTGWLALASYNHIANPNLIYAGQTVCIPRRGADNAAPRPIQSNGGTASVAVQPTPISKASSTSSTGSISSTGSTSTGSIATMINQTFGAYGQGAINVARCESGLNPNAYNPSGAAGLFQIMPARHRLVNHRIMRLRTSRLRTRFLYAMAIVGENGPANRNL